MTVTTYFTYNLLYVEILLNIFLNSNRISHNDKGNLMSTEEQTQREAIPEIIFSPMAWPLLGETCTMQFKHKCDSSWYFHRKQSWDRFILAPAPADSQVPSVFLTGACIGPKIKEYCIMEACTETMGRDEVKTWWSQTSRKSMLLGAAYWHSDHRPAMLRYGLTDMEMVC